MELKTFFEHYKFYLAGGGLFIGLVIFLFIFMKEDTVAIEDISMNVSEDIEGSEVDAKEADLKNLETTVYVEVKGAVNSPGVYELPSDARVKNALDIANVSENADLLTVNQSKKLTDEMVIYIPFKGEINHEEIKHTMTVPSAEETSEAKVNINTASLDELMTLNGIGEKKAQTIIEYREETGLFMKLEDIKNIPGIGDKTFITLEPHITID